MSDISQMDEDARAAHLKMVMDELILKIMINLNERGFGTSEVLAALDEVCDKQHLEYQGDAGLAEDS